MLDVVYSAKSGAAFFELAKRRKGPIIFWATKSTAQMGRADRGAAAVGAEGVADLARSRATVENWRELLERLFRGRLLAVVAVERFTFGSRLLGIGALAALLALGGFLRATALLRLRSLLT